MKIQLVTLLIFLHTSCLVQAGFIDKQLNLLVIQEDSRSYLETLIKIAEYETRVQQNYMSAYWYTYLILEIDANNSVARSYQNRFQRKKFNPQVLHKQFKVNLTRLCRVLKQNIEKKLNDYLTDRCIQYYLEHPKNKYISNDQITLSKFEDATILQEKMANDSPRNFDYFLRLNQFYYNRLAEVHRAIEKKLIFAPDYQFLKDYFLNKVLTHSQSGQNIFSDHIDYHRRMGVRFRLLGLYYHERYFDEARSFYEKAIFLSLQEYSLDKLQFYSKSEKDRVMRRIKSLFLSIAYIHILMAKNSTLQVQANQNHLLIADFYYNFLLNHFDQNNKVALRMISSRHQRNHNFELAQSMFIPNLRLLYESW